MDESPGPVQPALFAASGGSGIGRTAEKLTPYLPVAPETVGAAAPVLSPCGQEANKNGKIPSRFRNGMGQAFI